MPYMYSCTSLQPLFSSLTRIQPLHRSGSYMRRKQQVILQGIKSATKFCIRN